MRRGGREGRRNQHRAPLITLTYETAGEAEAAQALAKAALTGVIDVTSHSYTSRT
jgi:hypothetical protein